QTLTYPIDSLDTQPAIPKEAVNIPPGRPSGPNARLQWAIYGNIRYPRTALTSGTGGKVLVYGVVDTTGKFLVDSAALFTQLAVPQSTPDENFAGPAFDYEGVVDNLSDEDSSLSVDKFPNNWSPAQKDLVREAIRVADNLPRFKPGTKAGAPVNAFYSVPVVFKYQGVGKKRPKRKKRKQG
ncbi:MAG: hypothetical protein AAF597_12260, partial [Bacteroidota bacterium]